MYNDVKLVQSCNYALMNNILLDTSLRQLQSIRFWICIDVGNVSLSANPRLLCLAALREIVPA